MSKIKLILKNKVIQTLIVSIPSFVSAFLVGVCVARILGDDAKGAFGLISFNIELFVLILGLSIGTAITYFISNKKIGYNKIFSMSIAIVLVGVVLVITSYLITNALGLNIIIYAKKYFSLNVVIYFFTLYFFTIFQQIAIAFLQGFQKINWINRCTAISTLVAPLFIIPYYFFVTTDEQNFASFDIVITLFTCIGVLNALPLFYYCSKIVRNEKIKFARFGWKNSFWPFIKFAFIGHLSNIVNFLNYRIDIWFITFFFYDQFDLLGHYLVAVTLSQIIWLIPKSINLVYFPVLCKNPSIELTIKISRFSNVLVLAVTLIGLLIAPFAIPFLYTEEFQASVIPFQVLLGGMFFSSLTKTISSYIFAVGKVKINLLATIVGVIITIILDLILIPNYGIIGAAWATNFTYFGIFTVCFVFLWINGKKDGIGYKVWSIFIPFITTTRINNGR